MGRARKVGWVEKLPGAADTQSGAAPIDPAVVNQQHAQPVGEDDVLVFPPRGEGRRRREGQGQVVLGRRRAEIGRMGSGWLHGSNLAHRRRQE